jgi:hypothetical protein
MQERCSGDVRWMRTHNRFFETYALQCVRLTSHRILHTVNELNKFAPPPPWR